MAMLTAIALIFGLFALLLIPLGVVIGIVVGCGVAVALLFAVRKVAEIAGLRPAPAKPEPADENAAPDVLNEIAQWENMMSYTGKPQKAEGMKQDGDKD
jgi:uncharacterized protein (DUF58 family)